MRAPALLAAVLLLATAACPSSSQKPAASPATEGAPTPAPTAEDTPAPAAPAAATPAAPAAPGKAALTADVYLASCRADLDKVKVLRAQILAAPAPRTVDNTLEPYNQLSIHLSDVVGLSDLYAKVHPDPAVREAGTTCEREARAIDTDLHLDRPLFDAISAVDLKAVDALTKRFVEKTLRDFRRSGVDKYPETRDRLKALADQQVELEQVWVKNITDDVRSVKIDPAQLAGLPEDYKAAHPPGKDGKVTITTESPDYLPFRTFATDAAARKALVTVYRDRAYPQNDPVLKKMLTVRAETARLLGYKNWADFITGDKMARSAANVNLFLEQVHKVSQPYAKKEYAKLLTRKRKDLPKATTVEMYDNAFYEELVRREEYAFDSQSVRPYFEFNRVRDGLLAITARMYGLEYKKVPYAESGAWHPDVDTYDVVLGTEKLGRIHLDLHPREGKYTHAAAFPMAPGVAGGQLAEASLVCNFPDPAKTTPALMSQDDVKTLFHEFGHLMHFILAGRHRWVYFSGFATEMDFVEAPSMMFEEWALDYETLKTFAKRYDTGEVIPEELVTKMRAANEFGKGSWASWQVFNSMLSLRYHTADPAKLDPTKELIALQKKFYVIPYLEGTHWFAAFGHMAEYSAQYYTYLWSFVIGRDLLTPFEKAGLLDEKTAHRYRDEILAPGGTRDAADLVKSFLGRPYDFKAFQRWLSR